MKNAIRKIFPYLLLIAYVGFVSVVLFQLYNRMDFMLRHPVRVSQEVREMITRLREMENIIPGLLSTPDLSYEQIIEVIQRQETAQDRSFDLVQKLFRGNTVLLDNLLEEMHDIRRIRRRLAAQFVGNRDFAKAVQMYRHDLHPQVVKVQNAMNAILSYTMRRMTQEKNETRSQVIYTIFVAAVVGLLIALAFYLAGRTESRQTHQLVTREKLFNRLSHNVDEVFIIASNANAFDYVTSNSGRLIGINNEAIIVNPVNLYNFMDEDTANWLKKNLDDPNLDQTEEKDFRTDAGTRSFTVTVTPIQEQSGRSYVVGIRDQTKTVQIHQALNDALENAHAASQAKSSFLSHMSHEIRTPMNAIIGMTTIALSKMDNPERVEDCLGKIGESSRHLLGLINDVLDMSKIENGKLSITHEPFSLPRAIQSINDLVRPQAQARQLDFEIRQENVDEEELVGDELRLNQVLLNILSNALKFTPAGGLITLTIKQLAKRHNNVRMRFVITDNGIGMSQEFLDRIYKPFEQATQTTTAKYGGTGLGMSITLNLITLMGGTINVESKEGEGSKFTVEIPFGFTDETASARQGLPRLRVLVVDDDPGTCEHASLLLEKMGLDVSWCTSGPEAVEMVKKAQEEGRRFDICFIDWKMPDMDGAETARQIRGAVGDDLLIIIISAYDWSPIETEAKEAGVNDFVAKPFFASTLYNVLLATTKRLGVGQQDIDAESANHDFTGRRILLVEDNEFNREIGNEFLEMVNATVENAENGQEAVTMFQEAEPGYYDLILMDVQMPVMDGYEATKAIRDSDHPDARKIHILAMTANAFSEDIANATAAGMDGHIAKPIDVNELYRAIAAHISQKTRQALSGGMA